MKVRLCYTVEVDDKYRRAINRFYGDPGLADREAVRRWLMSYGDSMDADLAETYDEDEDDE